MGIIAIYRARRQRAFRGDRQRRSGAYADGGIFGDCRIPCIDDSESDAEIPCRAGLAGESAGGIQREIGGRGGCHAPLVGLETTGCFERQRADFLVSLALDNPWNLALNRKIIRIYDNGVGALGGGAVESCYDSVKSKITSGVRDAADNAGGAI